MPLNCEIRKKNGHVVKVAWDDHTLNCFLSIGMSEGDPELWAKFFPEAKDNPDYFKRTNDEGVEYEIPMNFMAVPVYYLETKAPLWKQGKQTIQNDHTYMIAEGYEPTPMGANGADAKPFVFKKGWELGMWRT